MLAEKKSSTVIVTYGVSVCTRTMTSACSPVTAGNAGAAGVLGAGGTMVAVMVGSAPTVGVSLGAGGVVRGADDVTVGVFTGVGGASGVPVAVGAAGCGEGVGATAAAGGSVEAGAHAASASSAAAHAMRRQRTIGEMYPFRLKCSSAKCTPADTRDWNAIRPVCLLKIGMLLL